MAFSKARRLANLMSADSNEIPAARRTLATDSITKAMINDNVIDIARLDVSDGANGLIFENETVRALCLLGLWLLIVDEHIQTGQGKNRNIYCSRQRPANCK